MFTALTMLLCMLWVCQQCTLCTFIPKFTGYPGLIVEADTQQTVAWLLCMRSPGRVYRECSTEGPCIQIMSRNLAYLVASWSFAWSWNVDIAPYQRGREQGGGGHVIVVCRCPQCQRFAGHGH
jgi:hypothetical protein